MGAVKQTLLECLDLARQLRDQAYTDNPEDKEEDIRTLCDKLSLLAGTEEKVIL